MTPRNFLVRGLLAGLVAGLLSFGVAYFVGEPHIDTAIKIEEAGASAAPAGDDGHDVEATEHARGEPAEHAHDEEGVIVSRANQSTWGLLTATLGIAVAIGGAVALVAAFAMGRFGRLLPESTTAMVAGIGFVATALVPFLKYPPNPPSVGNPDTLGDRTLSYFGFILLSIATASIATALGRRLAAGGVYRGILLGGGFYLVVMVTMGNLLPTVNEIGSFPADTLWYYRRASILSLATMWLVIGIVLSSLIQRLRLAESAINDRRAFAASL